jgi:hypothetical protein
MIDVETAGRAGVQICIAWYGFGRLRGEPLPAGNGWVAHDGQEVGAIIERFLSVDRIDNRESEI